MNRAIERRGTPWNAAETRCGVARQGGGVRVLMWGGGPKKCTTSGMSECVCAQTFLPELFCRGTLMQGCQIEAVTGEEPSDRNIVTITFLCSKCAVVMTYRAVWDSLILRLIIFGIYSTIRGRQTDLCTHTQT